MKLALKLSLFLFSLVLFENQSFSLTNYQIKKICKNEKRKSFCIKSLKQKKSNLEKGKFIEIPVIPYEK